MIVQYEPLIDEIELHYLEKVVASRYLTEAALTQQFEERIRELTGAHHAIAYCNGTAALFAALKALGLPDGAKVAVPNLTFIATIESVLFAGLKPVLVDVDADTLCMGLAQAERALAEHPDLAAIVPVHLYGAAAPISELVSWARDRNLRVVEDAAQAIGVRWHGQHVGTFAELGILSFFGNKTITSGQGGMILCSSKEHRDRVYRMKNHGRLERGTFEHETLGFNFAFTEMQAAVGLAQLDKLPRIRERKRQIHDLYAQRLADSVRLQTFPEGCEPTHWMACVFLEDVAGTGARLRDEFGIQTRRFFYPLDRQLCLQDSVLRASDLTQSHQAYEHGLSLPSAATLSDEQVDYVAAAIRRCVE